MKESLLKSIQYEEWANAIILRCLQQCDEPGERNLQLFAHVLAPQSIWLSRASQEVPSIGLWPDWTLEECAQRMPKFIEMWRKFINNATDEDLRKPVTFKRPGMDQERTIPVYEVVAHLVNHGTYHRGQIILGLKGKIDPLPLTTYIGFLVSLD
ncbi:DinB family protein [Runella sp.]|uniref:DinB family protein n=1 Tax=Runella sp. TaxID=1960881 RepID=UPI003D0BF502